MNKLQKLIILGAIATFGNVFAASAQIYIGVRPVRPVVVRTVAPSPRHVWIDEDWSERDGKYAFVGGHWEEGRAGYRYVPGHWQHERRGHYWAPGKWVVVKERRHR